MAKDLSESPFELLNAKHSGQIPNPRHDVRLIQRAVFQGVSLTHENLRTHRNKESLKMARSERSEAIQAFYDLVGGVSVVAAQTGITKNSLYLAKSRAVFSKKDKFELKMLAVKFGISLSDELFVEMK